MCYGLLRDGKIRPGGVGGITEGGEKTQTERKIDSRSGRERRRKADIYTPKEREEESRRRFQLFCPDLLLF